MAMDNITMDFEKAWSVPYYSCNPRLAGNVTAVAVKYNFLKDYELLSEDKDIAAKIGVWFWRFEGVRDDVGYHQGDIARKDLNVAAGDANDFDKSRAKINGGENPSVRLPRYATARNAVTQENAYGNMGLMLNGLGINTINTQGYSTKFGLNLQKRSAIEIDPNKKLLADSVINVDVNQQTDLMQTIQTQFDIDEGDDMVFIAMADAPPVPVYQVATATQKQSAAVKKLTYGTCNLIPAIISDHNYETALKYPGGDFDVAWLAMQLLVPWSEGPHTADSSDFLYDLAYSFEVKRLNAPKHGLVVKERSDKKYISSYVPNKNYTGKDRVDFLVTGKDLDGKPFEMTVKYYINVVPDDKLQKAIKYDKTYQQAIKQYCGHSKGTWRISESDASSSLISDFTGYNYLPPNITFRNLTGAAVGETNGEGTNATITLDTDAAGHGWYEGGMYSLGGLNLNVDFTEGLKDISNWLPTSNPNEWVAKAGTAAEGKMDMLSVLLHEYGHALGIDHSHDAHDYMGTTLTPGMRRLPSSDEMQLMAQLAAEAREAILAGNGYTLTVANSKDTLTPALSQEERGQDVPSLPINMGFGISFLGLLRRNNSASSIFANAANKPAQYDIAANATLTNGNFSVTPTPTLPLAGGGSLSGWETTGKVTSNPSMGSGRTDGVTLSEVSTSQTRLNQVFVVGELDRYLSFTLSGIALDDAANGPDDAFEVALLSANTGAALTTPIGMTHTDAMLNLQANGNELAAQGVTHLNNPDGSRTYVLDLAGIAAGTAVNLSFDLIGFGRDAANTNSHVTVRDVKLLSIQTLDDVATGTEDSIMQIIALANDTNANQAGFAPVVVAVPSHGTVIINADGSFSYTPTANYYGADSFTYKISDGVVDSNVSTVSLTA
jgi:hypothetical protein